MRTCMYIDVYNMCTEVYAHISTNKENERMELQISFKKAKFYFKNHKQILLLI